MQSVCRGCGRLVGVNQNFCGNCGTRLNVEDLDEPTERSYGSGSQRAVSRVLADDSASPGAGSRFAQNSNTTFADGQDTYGALSMTASRTYTASWPMFPSAVLPQTDVLHTPVTSLPGYLPIPNGLSPEAFALSQEKTHILASGTQNTFSRRKVLRALAGLSILAAAGIGIGAVVSSREGASAATRSTLAKPPSSTRPLLSAIPAYTYTGHRAPVNGVIWEPITPSGSNAFRIASCASDVNIWDGLSGNDVTPYNAYQGEVFSLSWCHSTNKVVSGNLDGTAHIWLAANGQYVNRLVGHNQAIRGVSWAKDGVHIATASDDTQVGLWLLDTQHNDASSPVFFQNHKDRVYAVNFSDDSQYLVSGSADGTAMLWSVQDHAYLATYVGHQGAVRAVAFAPGSPAPSGPLLASGGVDQSAQVWTWNPLRKTFHLLTRYTGHHATVNTLAWSPDGSRIASGDSAGQVHIWQSQTGEQLLTFRSHQAEVSALAWDPAGQYLASAGWDHTVQVTRISCTNLACMSR